MKNKKRVEIKLRKEVAMNYNLEAFKSLRRLHDYLIAHYSIPDLLHGHYGQLIKYVLDNYSFTTKQKRDLKMSVSIRNKVCHFQDITDKDLIVLYHLSSSLMPFKTSAHS